MSGAIAAAAIGGGMALAGGIGSAVIGSSAASNASNAQVQAANAQIAGQERIAQQNIDQQNRIVSEQMQLISPYYRTGEAGLANLSYLLGIPDSATYVDPTRLAGGTSPSVTAGGLFTPLPSQPGGTTGGVNPAPIGGPGLEGPPAPNVNATQLAGLTQAGTQQAASGEPKPIVNPPPTGPGNAAGGGGPAQFLNNDTGLPAPVGSPLAPGGTTPPAAGSSNPTGGSNIQPGQPLTGLVNPALGGYGSLYQGLGTQFQAPTDVTQQNDPGYQFRLKQGMQALDAGAAARGGLLTGGTAKGEQMFGQDYASNEYGNVYSRAVNQYGLNRQSYLDRYNALAAMSGTGQLAAGQGGGYLAQTGNNLSNIYNLLGSQFGQAQQNIGNAQASGYINSANAINGGIGQASNALSQYAMLQSLLGGNSNSNITSGADWALGMSAPCWIAARLYGGWTAPKTRILRHWLVDVYSQTGFGAAVVALYRKFGQRIARSRIACELLRPLFDCGLKRATAYYLAEAV